MEQECDVEVQQQRPQTEVGRQRRQQGVTERPPQQGNQDVQNTQQEPQQRISVVSRRQLAEIVQQGSQARRDTLGGLRQSERRAQPEDEDRQERQKQAGPLQGARQDAEPTAVEEFPQPHADIRQRHHQQCPVLRTPRPEQPRHVQLEVDEQQHEQQLAAVDVERPPRRTDFQSVRFIPDGLEIRPTSRGDGGPDGEDDERQNGEDYQRYFQGGQG